MHVIFSVKQQQHGRRKIISNLKFRSEYKFRIMDEKYRCKKCNWEGSSEELEYDSVDTCFGDDKIEMCPKCGSYEVVLVKEE